MRGALTIVIAVSLTAACHGHTRFPMTQQPSTMSQLNAKQRGTAPDVARTVTAERLVRARAEPQNWLTYYGAYDGQRYSALEQINTTNVSRLKVAWVFQNALFGLSATPATYAFEAAPLVVDGVMYTTGPDGYVWALDAATGEQLWTYRHAVPLDVPLCCGNVNRGAAVANGRIYFATPNGYLVALDARTGQKVWQRAFADVRAGESATMAPLIVKNMIIVGSSGAEYGVRGHLDAYALDNGTRLWRRYTTPRPGEPGSNTWPGNSDAWARGGGTTWITGSYDPELDLVYWGTGNPAPVFDGSVRPGANLFTNSVLAIRPNSGEIAWHYQWTPHDVWDYDGVNENILFDAGGRRLLAHFDKNGYLYVLDRTNGSFVRATPFVRTTWGRVDAQGRHQVERIPTREGTEICPGPAGGKEWPHASYSPRTGLLYAPIVELCARFSSEPPEEFQEGMHYFASAFQPLVGDQWGGIKAYDPLTGREVWSQRSQFPVVASLLSTAGDLVFAGHPTGDFTAYHARTGDKLWEFRTGSGIHSNPIAYSVAGRQYIAVWSGWGGWMEGFAPTLYGAPRGGALFVFTVEP